MESRKSEMLSFGLLLSWTKSIGISPRTSFQRYRMSTLPPTVDFYCVRWLDKENVEQLRNHTRKAHLEYMERIQCVSLGGPLLDKDNVEKGRILLLQGVNQAKVEQVIQQDPFHSILSSVNLTIFKRVRDFPSVWPQPLYVVYCLDDPNKEHIRLEQRPQHRSWWQNETRVVSVGPMASLNDDSSSLIGSLFFVTGESVEQVQHWASQDPYAEAGLFQQVSVYQWKRVVENGQVVESF
ncbi:uncharacterized protein Gasu_28860 [Galdieria sulphuraria]|uniref:YCII-related domain-containing protein n=1 Tax=Galdieria sulphuraria TaxID=130081 RepID=M2XHU3_GALSU|nr:uncharacterized protein Gasu_28860 [Galdieria sulphuraria]EME29662.1 hypothetical protein Gasu_28860 [Galdieria sulphuraria]|eukprot:XP_005706182.1 hypothetical protein Gasu_28860 [Galdieria sulphuraria]